MTKAQYLSEYKHFINEVKENRNVYTEKDWKKTDEKFYKYSEILYKKFENEFITEEKIVLVKYHVEYDIYRHGGDVKETFFKLFDAYLTMQENVNTKNIEFLLKHKDKMKTLIEDYIEDDLKEDADFVVNQTKKVINIFSKILHESIEDDT